MLSCFSRVQLFAALWTVAHQAPLSMGIPRQKYWSQLLFPSLGDLPNQGSNPHFLCLLHLAGGFFTTGFPGGSEGRASATMWVGSIPGSGRSPGEGNGNPLQYLAWKIPWTEKPGRLQSVRWQRVRHGWATSLALALSLPLALPGKPPWCFSSVQFSRSVRLFVTPWIAARPGLPVHHQLSEFTQTHVHRVGDSIQPSQPLSSSSPPAPNPSQHQGLPMSQLFTWGGQSIGASVSALPMNTRTDLL